MERGLLRGLGSLRWWLLRRGRKGLERIRSAGRRLLWGRLLWGRLLWRRGLLLRCGLLWLRPGLLRGRLLRGSLWCALKKSNAGNDD